MVRTRVGYAGGAKKEPTYRSLGDHTEAFQVDYDPSKITFAQLLAMFWDGHEPTDAAYSKQYAAILFVADDEQEAAARASLAAEQKERTEAGPHAHRPRLHVLARRGLPPEVRPPRRPADRRGAQGDLPQPRRLPRVDGGGASQRLPGRRRQPETVRSRDRLPRSVRGGGEAAAREGEGPRRRWRILSRAMILGARGDGPRADRSTPLAALPGGRSRGCVVRCAGSWESC